MKKQYYKKVDYPEQPCVICGKMFKPKRSNQRTCGSTRCKNRLAAQHRKEWATQNLLAVNKQRKEREAIQDASYGLPEKPKEKHKSNIIAIGYAERQMADSLRKAGKVKVEL